MNKRQFLKFGIIGSIISMFAPKSLALREQKKLPSEILSNKMVLTSSLVVTKNGKFPENSLYPCFYNLEGNLQEILVKQHRQTLAVMAMAIVNLEENKHLNLDFVNVLKILVEKYKINID